MIFVMGMNKQHAEAILAQLYYPKHHATIVTDVTQIRGVTMWTPIIFFPKASLHPQYQDVLDAARTSQMCVMHMQEDHP